MRGQPRTRPLQPCPQPFLTLDPLGARSHSSFLAPLTVSSCPPPLCGGSARPTAPLAPHTAPPCQDGTCPCTDMPSGTKLWTSQDGPAHVPPLLAVTLPQTPPPLPPRLPSALLSTQKRPRLHAALRPRGQPPRQSTLPSAPSGQGARAFCSTPLAALCGGQALRTPQGLATG